MTERLTYSVSEAAEAIGIGRSMLYTLLGRGELQSVRVGRRTLIPVQAVLEFLGVEAAIPALVTPGPAAGRTYIVTVTPVDEGREGNELQNRRSQVRVLPPLPLFCI